jgi:hypothetical protein
MRMELIRNQRRRRLLSQRKKSQWLRMEGKKNPNITIVGWPRASRRVFQIGK